jgi:hypothetical protein
MFNILNKLMTTRDKETDKKIMQEQIDNTNPTLSEILKITSEVTDEDRKYTNAINTDYLD